MPTQSFSHPRKFLIGTLLSVLMISVSFAKEKPPEVSKDGLHLVKDSKVAIAYVKPGASLEPYTKVKILDCYVQFKKNWERDYNLSEVGLDGRVTDKDAEDIKKRLADEFREMFTKVLTEGGHEVVDDTGPDVLLLRPAIINLDVKAPDTHSVGMTRTWVRSAGEMTLFLELYDSANSTLLARIIDAQAGDQGGMAMLSNEVSNRAAADRILRHWATLLDKHIGVVKGHSAAE
jgi:hypothetical protein